MQSRGPENQKTRLPLIEKLIKPGWKESQIQYAPEWRIPKTPSEASKREIGNKYEGYPVDVAIFDSEEDYLTSWETIKYIIETKEPDKNTGLSQLETYLSLEPRAIAGFWTNSKEVHGIFRQSNGKFKIVENCPLPLPGEDILLSGEKPLTYNDLTDIDSAHLKNILNRLLAVIVARDSRSTRREDQLNQLLNLLLVKLESDKKGKFAATVPLVFQVWQDEKESASKISELFEMIKRTNKDVFVDTRDSVLKLDDHSIHAVAYELGRYKLFSQSIDSISIAFQVLRKSNLKSEEGQYFTPTHVIRSAVKLMDITYEDIIIDPACGSGGFLIECFRQYRDNNPNLSEQDIKDWAQKHLYGVDKDEINIKLTKATMIMLGDGSAHIYLGDSIRRHTWEKQYPHLQATMHEGDFTCIITTPPFGKNLTLSSTDAKSSGFDICRIPKKKSDGTFEFSKKEFQMRELGIVFLERCHWLLQRGGRLGIILPETYFFSDSYVWLQQWIESRFIIRGIINIPMEAFQGFCRAKTNFYVFEKV